MQRFVSAVLHTGARNGFRAVQKPQKGWLGVAARMSQGAIPVATATAWRCVSARASSNTPHDFSIVMEETTGLNDDELAMRFGSLQKTVGKELSERLEEMQLLYAGKEHEPWGSEPGDVLTRWMQTYCESQRPEFMIAGMQILSSQKSITPQSEVATVHFLARIVREQMEALGSAAAEKGEDVAAAQRQVVVNFFGHCLLADAVLPGLVLAVLHQINSEDAVACSKRLMDTITVAAGKEHEAIRIGEALADAPVAPVEQWPVPEQDFAGLKEAWLAGPTVFDCGRGMITVREAALARASGAEPEGAHAFMKNVAPEDAFNFYVSYAQEGLLEALWALYYVTKDSTYVRRIMDMAQTWQDFEDEVGPELLFAPDQPPPPQYQGLSEVALRVASGRRAMSTLIFNCFSHASVTRCLCDEAATAVAAQRSPDVPDEQRMALSKHARLAMCVVHLAARQRQVKPDAS